MLVAVCRSDENRSQSAKSANNWQGEELVVSFQVVLGESAEIRKVHRHGGEETNDSIQAGQRRVRGVHVRRGYMRVPCDEGTSTMCDNRSPEKESQKGWRYNDTFDQEEDAELLDGHACENRLEDPINELLLCQRE